MTGGRADTHACIPVGGSEPDITHLLMCIRDRDPLPGNQGPGAGKQGPARDRKSGARPGIGQHSTRRQTLLADGAITVCAFTVSIHAADDRDLTHAARPHACERAYTRAYVSACMRAR